ncbi:unnamed protein product [Leptidea sinapis]|uniref:Uncharacterized protein n=1 Tax=Leptidea sinapis TaxID=189913 RepID=A0A5E4Q2P6_9NEOP|nr:unnamed protein product [Leptidea sinapis]
MERMKESQAGLQNDLEDTKQLICKLKSEIKNNVKLIEEIKSPKQQQWGRLNNLEIVGLPEKSNESLPDIIRKIALHAGVALTSEQIEFIHRVQPRQHISGRPKPIVVKLSNRDLKDHILSGLRRKRGIQTSDIGISGSSQKFFVNEHLTPI